MDNKCILQKVCRSITQFVTFRAKKRVTKRGFIKVLNRRATEFDTRAKNWQGPEGLSPQGVREHVPPEKFEILQSQGCVFLHFEAADNDFQQPKKDNFSRQFNHDLIPIPTTQIGLFGSLLIALLIIILTQSHCQHLSRNQSQGQSLHLEGPDDKTGGALF